MFGNKAKYVFKSISSQRYLSEKVVTRVFYFLMCFSLTTYVHLKYAYSKYLIILLFHSHSLV